jgi:hypothetical protein
VLITVGIAKTADEITAIVQSYTGATQDIAGHVDWLEGPMQKQKIVNEPGAIREHTSDRVATADCE